MTFRGFSSFCLFVCPLGHLQSVCVLYTYVKLDFSSIFLRLNHMFGRHREKNRCEWDTSHISCTQISSYGCHLVGLCSCECVVVVILIQNLRSSVYLFRHDHCVVIVCSIHSFRARFNAKISIIIHDWSEMIAPEATSRAHTHAHSTGSIVTPNSYNFLIK